MHANVQLANEIKNTILRGKLFLLEFDTALLRKSEQTVKNTNHTRTKSFIQKDLFSF